MRMGFTYRMLRNGLEEVEHRIKERFPGDYSLYFGWDWVYDPSQELRYIAVGKTPEEAITFAEIVSECWSHAGFQSEPDEPDPDYCARSAGAGSVDLLSQPERIYETVFGK